MNQMLLDFAFQYYAAGRFGVRAKLSPVTGNLFHHAIELFLKAHLSISLTPAQMKKNLSHDLNKTWSAFKAAFPSACLTAFDQLISSLDKFETIRYPDELIAKGGDLIIAMDRRAASATGAVGASSPRYEVTMSDVDELVATILKLSSRNPAFFTAPLRLDAQRAIKYRNANRRFFFPAKPRKRARTL